MNTRVRIVSLLNLIFKKIPWATPGTSASVKIKELPLNIAKPVTESLIESI